MTRAAILGLFLALSCGAAPDEMTLYYGRGDMDFDGTPDVWSDFGADTESVGISFTWYLHKPVVHEVRGLRNDMRVRAHEATVEEEEEKEKAELIAEAAEQAKSIPDEEGRWDWLYDNVEVWVMVLAGLLGILWRVGVWVGKREAQENK